MNATRVSRDPDTGRSPLPGTIAVPLEQRGPLVRTLRLLQASDSKSLFVAAACVLLLAILPSGILSGNEEHYLADAYRSVYPNAWPSHSNFLGGLPHAFVFNELFGRAIGAIGFSAAQILGRLLAVALYSLALARLFACLRLRVIDLAIVLMAFIVLGEGLVGDEWMFRGIEPKVLAYGFVLLAMVEFLRGKSATCFAYLVVTVYLHALVGGLWAVIIFLGFMLQRPPQRRTVVLHAAIAAVFVAPYGVFLLRQGYAQFDAFVDHAGPSAGWIQTYVAYPWHTTPFVDLKSFLKWMPGIVLTAVIGAAAWVAVRHARQESTRSLARLVALSSGWVLVALVLTYVFDDGRLGSYLLFRPSSLGLLLAFVLLAVYVGRLPDDTARWVRLGMLAVLLPVFAQSVLHSRLYLIGRDLLRQSTQVELIEWIKASTPPDSVFLVEPGIEDQFFDFERRTGRANAFVHRFTPGSAADIREWYKRYLFREQVMAAGCSVPTQTLHVDYLLASVDTAQRLAPTCGKVLHESGGYRILSFDPAR